MTKISGAPAAVPAWVSFARGAARRLGRGPRAAVALSLALAGASCRGTGALEPDGVRSVTVGRWTRTYTVVAPPRAATRGALPLVLVFHGLGGSGAQIRFVTGLDELARESGALVVYPDALSEADRGWALGCPGCTPADRLGVDDVAFVRAILNDVRRDFRVDGERIYATGFSMGGWMSYLLGCTLDGQVAAIAAVGALVPRPVREGCALDHPVSVAIFAGAEDRMQRWEGRAGPFGWLDGRETAAAWAQLNGCATPPDSATVAPGGAPVTSWRYPRCRGGGEVVLHRLDGVGHRWNRTGFDVTREIRGFFRLAEKR